MKMTRFTPEAATIILFTLLLLTAASFVLADEEVLPPPPNNPPVAVCKPFTVHPYYDDCIILYPIDIDGGCYDPDGPSDIDEICITAVDGTPIGCEPSEEICGLGTHTVTLRITDWAGEYDECDATIELVNEPPVAVCAPFSRHPDPDGCFGVSVPYLDGGCYDPDGNLDIEDISIVAVDGVEVPYTQSVDVCGIGTHTVTLRVTDRCRWYDDCDATVTVENAPPVLECQTFSRPPMDGCCVSVDVRNFVAQVSDPDGDDVEVCAVALDGSPLACVQNVEACGAFDHTVTVRATDEFGAVTECDATLRIENDPPVAVCRPYSFFHDEDCCVDVSVADIDYGSYDPDGDDDLLEICISAVNGTPVGCEQTVRLCGGTNHSLTMSVTDPCGATTTCVSDVEILNEPPVAVCQDHIEVADSNCCAMISAAEIDDGSYDPDGPDDIADLCIQAVDGMPVGCVDQMEVCGAGIHTVTLAVTDLCGETGTCDAAVEVIDVTPPEITVSLNRYTLWPCNHKMVDIVATVEAADNCDADPDIILVSIDSNEPEDDGGDGETDDDIQGADFFTEDYEFQLRSERSGTRFGRVYTIVYRATDFSGNSADATVYVRVPHNQTGLITATTGFTCEGTGFEPSRGEFVVVVLSRIEVYGINHNGNLKLVEAMFDATGLDLARTYVGNTMGVLLPEDSKPVDQNGDGLMDLALWYKIAEVEPLVENVFQNQIGEVWVGDPADPVGIHYRSAGGVDYLVDDIFGLGAPETLGGSGSAGVDDTIEETGVTRLLPVKPNPSCGAFTIRFSLAGEEKVLLRIYDARGKLVRTLENGILPAGTHQIIWGGQDSGANPVAQGAYFVQFRAGMVETTKKIMLVR
jgi:hypothetical protein